MSRVVSTRNPDGKTWRLELEQPGRPTLVCLEAPPSLVKRATEFAASGQLLPVPADPQPVASAVSWILTLILLPGPLFWLAYCLVNR